METLSMNCCWRSSRLSLAGGDRSSCSTEWPFTLRSTAKASTGAQVSRYSRARYPLGDRGWNRTPRLRGGRPSRVGGDGGANLR